ncbi:MAG: S1 RNA-binding domain-containing protein, partial [Anaerolineae bacterium]|nr:S1 RNA-binding domain-containing protein [Anaerolineae bacterium]
MEQEKGSPNEPISMENLEEEALDVVAPKKGQLREGIILDIRNDGLVVDIGAKLDGFVPKEDYEDLDEVFKINQEIPIVITNSRNSDGTVELSISQARLREDWLTAEKLKEEEATYEGNVLSANRGGLTVEFGKLRGFVPMSHLIGFNRIRQASERHRRLENMVDKPIMLKVIEVNPRRKRLILSQTAAAKEWRSQRRQKLLEELEAGQVRTGRLSQITDFGLFINLGGLDGLVHISELSWGRIENPADVYKVGQRIKVKVLDLDREKQRIALSIKALKPDPWESVSDRYQKGTLVQGKITQIVDFGVFVELEPGIEGLLHNSELRDHEQREEIEAGATVLSKIIRIEPDRRRIGLSVRQVTRQEWEEWAFTTTIQDSEAEDELEPEDDDMLDDLLDEDIDEIDVDIDFDEDEEAEEIEETIEESEIADEATEETTEVTEEATEAREETVEDSEEVE